VQLHHQERKKLDRAVSKQDRDIHRLMDKPGVAGLPSRGTMRLDDPGFQYKGWKDSQRQVQEIRGGHRIDEGRYRVRETRESKRDKKETSECEVRVALILTESTWDQVFI